jgi:hypothetical protein
VLIASLVPLIAIVGLGNLRPLDVSARRVAATALLAGLGVYDALHDLVVASMVRQDGPSTSLWARS